MAATTVIHVRVDEHIKNRATETLASMGLTVPDDRDAIRGHDRRAVQARAAQVRLHDQNNAVPVQELLRQQRALVVGAQLDEM